MRHHAPTLTALSVVVAVGGCAKTEDDPVALTALYENSIPAAAMKSPDYVRALQPFDVLRARVTVAHLQQYPTIENKYYLWVTHPDELKAHCRGKPNPLLAMQEALGMPPIANQDFKVFTFEVPPRDIFRPCASSPDIGTTQCAIEPRNSTNPKQTATEHFVLKQLMDSYQNASGHPFTAMGWSYDWSPDSPTHQGVSEYVVRPGAAISKVSAADPATFCNSP